MQPESRLQMSHSAHTGHFTYVKGISNQRLSVHQAAICLVSVYAACFNQLQNASASLTETGDAIVSSTCFPELKLSRLLKRQFDFIFFFPPSFDLQDEIHA